MTERIVGPHPACDCIARQVLHDQRCAIYRSDPKQNAAATPSPDDGVALSEDAINSASWDVRICTGNAYNYLGLDAKKQALAAIRLRERIEELEATLSSEHDAHMPCHDKLEAAERELSAFTRPIDIDGMIYWGSCPHGVARQQVVPADYAVRQAAQLRVANERIAQINAELEQFKRPCENVSAITDSLAKLDEACFHLKPCGCRKTAIAAIDCLRNQASQLRAAQEELAEWKRRAEQSIADNVKFKEELSRYRDAKMPEEPDLPRIPWIEFEMGHPVLNCQRVMNADYYAKLWEAHDSLRTFAARMQVERDAAVLALSDRSAGKIHSDLKDRNEAIRTIEDKP